MTNHTNNARHTVDKITLFHLYIIHISSTLGSEGFTISHLLHLSFRHDIMSLNQRLFNSKKTMKDKDTMNTKIPTLTLLHWKSWYWNCACVSSLHMFLAKVKPSAFLQSLLRRILQLPLNLICQNIVLGEPHIHRWNYLKQSKKISIWCRYSWRGARRGDSSSDLTLPYWTTPNQMIK